MDLGNSLKTSRLNLRRCLLGYLGGFQVNLRRFSGFHPKKTNAHRFAQHKMESGNSPSAEREPEKAKFWDWC